MHSYTKIFTPVKWKSFICQSERYTNTRKTTCNYILDVSWMDATFLSNDKMSEHKPWLFEHAQSVSKWPAGSAYIGNFINYLLYHPAPFPRDLWIDLEGSSTFLPLMLSMHINRLGLFSHLYRTLLNCLSMCPGSWVATTTVCVEVEWNCAIAV